MEVTTIIEYQQCRIHASHLNSGTWVASIVAPGSIVQHVPGEFASPTDAILAAKRQIDAGGPVASPSPSV